MYGKLYSVLEICESKTVALPSLDHSPKTVVTKLNHGMR